jgi:hypothetical protein
MNSYPNLALRACIEATHKVDSNGGEIDPQIETAAEAADDSKAARQDGVSLFVIS